MIKMALPPSTHVQENCLCFSPDAFRHLSSEQREGAHITCMYTELSDSIHIYVVNPKQVIN